MSLLKNEICDISEKKCNTLDKIDVLALGETCKIDIYNANNTIKTSKLICSELVQSNMIPVRKSRSRDRRTKLGTGGGGSTGGAVLNFNLVDLNLKKVIELKELSKANNLKC